LTDSAKFAEASASISATAPNDLRYRRQTRRFGGNFPSDAAFYFLPRREIFFLVINGGRFR
jgi:hypothetical protein